LPSGLLGLGGRAPCGPAAGRFVSCTAMGKKVLEDLAAGLLQEQALPGDTMVVLQIENIDDRTDGSGLRIGGAIINGADAGLDNSSSTHDTRFERDIEIAAIEPPGLQAPARLADRDQLRVQGDILQGLAPVMTAGDDPALVHDDCSNRHLADQLRLVRFFQGCLHEIGIIVQPGWLVCHGCSALLAVQSL